MTNLERITALVSSGKMTLKQASEEIDQLVIKLQQDDLEKQKQISEDINRTTEELNKAIGQGDLSENAEYTNAISALKQYRIQYANLATRLEAMSVDLENKIYTPIGMAIMYTTVLLEDKDTKVRFVCKIFPDNISAIENCILDASSRIAKALNLASVGDIIDVENYSTGEMVHYEVLDMY